MKTQKELLSINIRINILIGFDIKISLSSSEEKTMLYPVNTLQMHADYLMWSGTIAFMEVSFKSKL